MKKSAAILFLLLSTTLSLTAFGQLPDLPQGRTVVLRGARLVDGGGGAPLDDSVIVIRDGRIAAVGPSRGTPTPGDAVEIGYRGQTIIPGLVSDHSHIGLVDGVNVVADNYNRANILRQLRQYEAYGVTTVTALGLNGPLFYDLRSDLHAGLIPGADLFGADRGIGVADGAPPTRMLPVSPSQLYRPETPDAARRAVREMAARRTDLVKLWLDDFGGTVAVKMKPEIYEAVIDEAHEQGLRVAAHIHDLADAKDILRAGADIVAHGVRDKPVDAELVELLKARAVWYVPTLALDEATFAYAQAPAWTRGPFFRTALQPALQAQLDDPDWRAKVLADPRAAAARRDLAMNQRNLKVLYDAGVRIGFGTDSGAQPLRVPGIAEHRELALMVEAGLTPIQAITVATSGASTLLGLTDRGLLAPGRLADLVVLGADPTIDIANTTRILAVWHRGKRVAGSLQ